MAPPPDLRPLQPLCIALPLGGSPPLIGAVLLAAALPADWSSPAREIRLVMGTTAEVCVVGLDTPATALDAAFAALDEVDRRMSLFKESELTRLNDAGAAVVSEHLAAVVAHALDVARDSGGAFDPSVEPLVRAAGGFGGPRRRLGRAERERLLLRVGASRVHFDALTRTVRLEAGACLDFGGIAKGYAADLALAALRGSGAVSGLVDLGGSSISVFGEPLAVALRDPDGGAPWASFRVSDAAVASSGGDQRKDHIFDPHTGLPARGVLATTVVAGTGIEADALSTAVYVLGREKGLALLRRRSAAGCVLVREKGRAILWTTPGFATTHGLKPRPNVEVRQTSAGESGR